MSNGFSQKTLVGVDLGGTKIVVALVDASGSVVDRTEIRDHRGKAEDETVRSVAACIRDKVATAGVDMNTIAGVGVGTTGHVDHARGVIITSSNLPGFTDYPISERLGGELGIPVRVDNDANAQAYAEYIFGAARDVQNAAFVTVSTGIGAGIIIDGRLYRGVTGTAGEIGHTIVKRDSTIQCGCGNYGCLMSHASGLALPHVVREHYAARRVRTSLDIDALSDEEINGEFVKVGFDRGDELCRDVVLEYADYLGIGLQNLFQVLNPGVIVLGGGLTAWGDEYLDRVRSTFYGYAREMMKERVEIRHAKLGVDAAVVGAAALLLEPE